LFGLILIAFGIKKVTQKENLRARLKVNASAKRLQNFFEATTQLMVVLARACGHDHLSQFNPHDITTWKKEIADLTGIQFAGVERSSVS